jgi:hypothetical protein
MAPPRAPAHLLPRVCERLHPGLDRVYWEHEHVLADARECAGDHVLRRGRRRRRERQGRRAAGRGRRLRSGALARQARD